MDLKQCSKCKEYFPSTLEYFYAHKSCKGGLLSYCKICDNKKRANYHKSHRKEKSEYDKKYRINNMIKLRNNKEIYYLSKRENFLLKAREHYHANKDIYYLQAKGRRFRERKLPYNFKIADKLFCLNYWNNSCAYCGEKLEKYELEHFIPVASDRFPGHIPTNILISCFKCNRNKAAKNPEDWVYDKFGEDRGYLILEKIMGYFDRIVV